MYLPYQPFRLQQGQTLVREFGALNRGTAIAEDEFSALWNLDASEAPLLRTRARRATVKQFASGETVNGFGCKNAILYTVDNGVYSALYLNGREVGDVRLSREKKTIVGMGAYAVIFPDGFFINTVDTSDKGFIENRKEIEATASVPLRLTPCTYNGSALTGATVSPSAPAAPENGDVWVDTSGDVTVYKVWNEGSGTWAQMSTVYIRFDYGNIDAGFKQWDGVRISGLSYEGGNENLRTQVEALNLEGALLQQVGTGFIEIAGIIDQAVELTGNIVIERRMPHLDYVTEAGNRLWGCRFGVVDGKVVNEILACKQGDCTNWQSYPGISTDSYALSLGTDGAFTGAVTYLGTPVFFKENYIHKIYGSTPSSFSMAQTNCRGVGRDMGESVVTDGSAVFYRSAVDFCVWSGAYPQSIGQKIADLKPDVVRGECLGNKIYYYIESGEEKSLLVFDTSTGGWYQETCDEVCGFAKDGHVLYLLCRDRDGVFRIDSANGEVTTLLVDEHTETLREGEVAWSAESGDVGFSTIGAQTVKMVQIRAKLGMGAVMQLFVSYDGGTFRPVMEKRGDGGAKAVTMVLKPVRCDHFRLRIEGRGACTLVSIAKTLELGSEKT